MPRLLNVAVAMVLLAAAWSPPILAQETGADSSATTMEDMGGEGMGGCPMMGGHGGMHRGMGGGMGAMLEKHLAKLKAGLKLTDAQAQAWASYEKAMLARRDTMRANRENMMKAGDATTPMARLDSHIEAMQKMLDALKALKPATETLYGALDETQKKSANKMMDVGGCKM